MKYIILCQSYIKNLEDAVNKHLKDNWQLQGGVSCSFTETDEYVYQSFAQAMTISDEDYKKTLGAFSEKSL